MEHAGTGNLHIRGNGADDVKIQAKNGEQSIICHHDGAVELYHDNSKKLETTSTGILVSGTVLKQQSSGEVSVQIGSTNAGGAAIYFDGDSNGDFVGGDYSWIRHNTSGDMEICADNPAANAGFYLKTKDGATNSIYCQGGGKVELMHNGQSKFETTSDGAEVKHTSGAAILKVTGSEGNAGAIWLTADDGDDYTDTCRLHQSTDGRLYIQNVTASNTWENMITAGGNGSVALYYDNSKKFETTSNGATLTGNHLKIDGNNGEKIILTGTANPYIRFHETSTEKFYMQWNSAGYFELYNQETSKALRIGGSGAEVLDNVKFTAGNSQDLQIYHDGHSRIKTSSSAAGNLVIDSNNDINLRVNNSEMAVHCKENTSVELYYDNSLKLETSANGIKVYDRIGVNITPTTALQFLDHSGSYEGRASWGNSADLQIYHNGTDSRIINAGSDLYLYTTGDHDVKILADSQNAVICKPDGAVELYYDNSKKLETIPEGIKITAGAENEEALVQVAYSTVPTNLSSSFDGTWGESFFSINKWRNSDGSSSWSASNNASYASAAIGLSGNTSSSVIQMYTAASPNTDPTSKFEVWSDGTANIVDGNLKVASGHGIDFSAHGNAGGMSSEVLHDYEEGTWTPTYRGTSTAGSTTHTTQVGHYVKVGSLVTLFFYVVWSSQNGGGHGCIGGLPWTGKSGSYSTGALMWNNISIDSNRTNVVTHQSGNSNVLYLYGSGVNNAWDSMPLDSAGNIIGQITYTI